MGHVAIWAEVGDLVLEDDPAQVRGDAGTTLAEGHVALVADGLAIEGKPHEVEEKLAELLAEVRRRRLEA